MGVAGDLLLAAVGTALVVLAPLEVALVTLVCFWLLVPGTLIVPYAPHLLFEDRLVLWAFAGRLLVRSRLPGEPPGAAYRLTAVHGALAVFVVAGFVDGVVLAPAGSGLAGDLHGWLAELDLAVLFVVVLAVVRTLGPWRVVRAVAAVAAVAVAIGMLERVTHHGWSHFFFEGLPVSYLAPGADLLGTRAGHVRAQAAAQFALEYGWVLVALAPLVLFATGRWCHRRPALRWAAVALPVGLAIAVLLSAARSSEAMLPVAVLAVLALAATRRQLAWGVVGVAVLAAVVWVGDPHIVSAAFSGGASDPASVRLDRLPVLFQLVLHHRWTGTGFVGAVNVFGGLDDAYALLYGTIGMAGLTAFLALGATTLAATAGAMRAERGSERRVLGVACFVGIGCLLVAAVFYDLVGTTQSLWAIIILAAVGVAVREQAPAPARRPPRWIPRLLLPAGGVVVGLLLAATTAARAAQTFTLFAVAPWVEADNSAPIDAYTGIALDNTLCGLATEPAVVAPGTSVHCLPAANIVSTVFPSEVYLTVSGPDPAAVDRQLRRSLAGPAAHMALSGGASETVQVGKPAWAVTAPLWAGAAGLVAMLLVPGRRRRRPGSAPQPADHAHGTAPPAGGAGPSSTPASAPVRLAAAEPVRGGGR